MRSRRAIGDTILVRKALWRLEDVFLQWFWCLTTIDRSRIGYDAGPLTRRRVAGHRRLRRRIHLCLLDFHRRRGKFGGFMAFWINEKSEICSASVNERVEDADVVWTYSQDPVPLEAETKIRETLEKKRPEVPVINHPDHYNAYHEDDCFDKLRAAGVSVPRSEFGNGDVGRTDVVYKVTGRHGASKFLAPYRGPVEGYRAFEFHDSRTSGGMFRKYRAYYILGNVIPYHVVFSDFWNVHRETRRRTEYNFDITGWEVESIKLIARTLKLEYFAVDYIRKSQDDLPVFTDVNVYPLPIEPTETAREFGYFGRWMVLDTRSRMGLPEPHGKSFWSTFDEAIAAFVAGMEGVSPGDPLAGQVPK